MKKEWNILCENPDTSEDLISLILKNRGIKNLVHFLKPKDKDFLPYTDLLNIDVAAQIVLKAIKENKRIHILGDIDVDGITSLTILYQYLFDFVDNLTFSFNSGKKHGIEHQDLESYVGKYDLVIAVDSSSSSFESQKFLMDNDIEFVVIDHHELDNEDPKYATIVNCTMGNYKNPYLSGSAMTFKFIKYIDFLIGATSADEFWDLATVGLVGDMMDISELSPENRYICSKGFSSLKNTGLKQILKTYSFNSTAVSFSVAPLCNAAVRLNKVGIAVALFMESDEKKCRKLICELEELKQIQNIQKDALVFKLDSIIELNKLDDQKVIGLLVEDNTGENKAEIVGLTGNVLVSKYERIFIIVHKTNKPGELRGSCRCTGIENFKDIVNQSGLVIFASGHQKAFGIGLKESNWKKLIIALNKALENVELKITSNADIILKPDELTTSLIKKIEYVNMISGNGFKPIQVVMENLEPTDITTMKYDKHSKFEASGIDFIQWNSRLSSKLSHEKGIYKIIKVIGTPGISSFKGKKSRQMIISDYVLEAHLEFFR